MSEGLRGVIVAHAEVAAALVAAVAAITGDDAGLAPVSNAGCGREALRERLDAAVGAGPALVFTDLAGGSCTAAAAALARSRADVRVVAGVSLPMLLEFAFHRDETPEAAAARAVGAGHAAVREVGR